jgi:Zn-finger nucleic acid-binding protein
MLCPRDNTDLLIEHHQGIEVDHCPTCNGRWLDQEELGHLEATVASDDERSGTIEYSKRAGELKCPKCQKTMRAFNYRAVNLEIDTCEDGHGFWLDAGEEGKVRDVMEDRVRGLARSATAEQAWGDFLGRLRKPSLWDKLTGKGR